MSEALKEQHLALAEATKGISAEFLYDIHERLIQTYHLRGDVLDFGAGKGLLTQRLSKMEQFHSVAAVDILPKPDDLPSSVRWIHADLEEPLAMPESSFDLLLCCEAISCFENPRALGREWFRVLRPGGSMLLSTPNNLSLRSILSLAVLGHFVEFGPRSYPYQKTALTKLDLERLCVEAGFEMPRIFYSDRGGLPKKPSVLWQSLGGSLFRGRWFSDQIFVLARKPL